MRIEQNNDHSRIMHKTRSLAPLTLFRMGPFWAVHGCGAFLSHISYNDETWHSYTLPKENPKNI